MVSIIAPVYNTEHYLPRCIESILRQTFNQFELLLIDDGSMDKSYNILKYYESLDDRIRVFRQNHGGVTQARLLGVRNASADWISFVDSDDDLPINSLEVLYDNIQNDIDIVVSNYKEKKVITAEEFVKMTLTCQLFPSIWGRLYRKNIFDHLSTISSLVTVGEDLLTNIMVGCNSTNKVKLIVEKIYNYYERPGSTMRTRMVSLQYEEFFMRELCRSIGNQLEKFKDELGIQCLVSLERLIVCRVNVAYESKWIVNLINWKKQAHIKLPLRSWIVVTIRHNKLARYLLAIERRVRMLLNWLRCRFYNDEI